MKTSIYGISQGILLAGFACLLASCGSAHFSAAVDVNPRHWDTPVQVVIPNADTTALRDINIFLRSNNRFKEDTLTVRVRLTAPGLRQHVEPFLLALPHTKSPASAMREQAVTYRRQVVFDRPGSYSLTITPCRPVRGVEAVGIHIIKSE